MTKLRRLIQEISSTYRYSRAEKLQNEGQHKASLAMLANFDGSSEYMLKAILLRAVNYHKLKEFGVAVQCYDEFQASGDLQFLKEADQEFLCAYAKYYCSAAKRNLDRNTVLKGSVAELRQLSEGASFTTKREFVV